MLGELNDVPTDKARVSERELVGDDQLFNSKVLQKLLRSLTSNSRTGSIVGLPAISSFCVDSNETNIGSWIAVTAVSQMFCSAFRSIIVFHS